MKTYSKNPDPSETVREILCPLCGSRKSKKFWVLPEGGTFARCSECRLVFQNPRPNCQDLAVRYDEDYFKYEIQNEEAFFKLMLLGLEDADFFGSIAPSLPGEPAVLDVGCATGRLLKHFKDRGWKTAGAELCESSALYGNRKYGVDIVQSSLEKAGFSDGQFSAVHASHLIEHVDDPLSFVEEVSRVLRPGGVFICVTPNIGGFQAKLFGSSWRSAIPDHVTLFDKTTLKRILLKADFTVEKIKTWGGLAVGTAPLWLKRPVDRLAKKWGFGDVVLMVARKRV